MSSVETQLFRNKNRVEVEAEFDRVLGLEYECTELDEKPYFNIVVFDVETKKEFDDILRIEEKFCAIDIDEVS